MPTAAPSAPKSKKTRNTGTLVVERRAATALAGKSLDDWAEASDGPFEDIKNAEAWAESNGQPGFQYRIIRVMGEYRVTSRPKLAKL